MWRGIGSYNHDHRPDRKMVRILCLLSRYGTWSPGSRGHQGRKIDNKPDSLAKKIHPNQGDRCGFLHLEKTSVVPMRAFVLSVVPMRTVVLRDDLVPRLKKAVVRGLCILLDTSLGKTNSPPIHKRDIYREMPLGRTFESHPEMYGRYFHFRRNHPLHKVDHRNQA